MSAIEETEQSEGMNHRGEHEQLSDLLSQLRVGIVHYWFVRFRGWQSHFIAKDHPSPDHASPLMAYRTLTFLSEAFFPTR
jgi:hypothetical protein